MANQITNYKCPACTGPLHFLGSTGKLECDYCGSSFSVEEIEASYAEADAKAEIAKEKSDEKEEEAKAERMADEWAVSDEQWTDEGMKAYNCPSCGADLIYEETTAATSCPYCGNPTMVPGQFAGMLKPDYVVPFKLDKEHAIQALKGHYKGKPLLPKTFTDENHINEIKGVYVPFWLYDGKASGSCVYKAEKDTETRLPTERVIVTKHYHVERAGSLEFEKIPADASSKMPDDLMDSIEPFNYNELKPFSKAYLTGFIADKYDVTAEENAERAVGRAKESTKAALRSDAKGYNSVSAVSENIHVEEGKVSYAMMPVWLLNTKWNGGDYSFAMNGQTGKLVGDLPVDKQKAIGYFAAIFAIVTLLAMFVIDCGLFGSVIIGAVIAGIVLLAMYGMMKDVSKAVRADYYIAKDGINITHRVDRFTHQTEKRIPIEK